MQDLIILRLYPTEPMSGADFRKLLEGLAITAYDLSFSKSVQGDQIGKAQGLAEPHTDTDDNSVDITATSIVQHYLDVNLDVNEPWPTGTQLKRELEAAATAVIAVELPAGYTEYPSTNSFDIRLKVTRDDVDIVDGVFDYNIQVANVLMI